MSTVDLNGSSRTPLVSERPKLSAGLCREALSHSGARIGAFSFGEKGGSGEG